MPSYRVSIAPMMDWTDAYYRHLMRLITRHTLLFTEMIHVNAVLHHPSRFLATSPVEHPIALQLGGSDPALLAQAAKLADKSGFCELNLNVGCPSERVQAGAFGACLMKSPLVVADCIRAMLAETALPITIKCRIGVDDHQDNAFLDDFIGACVEAGSTRFYVHARLAYLKGLSPKENREVPPLRYDRVLTLKRDFPLLDITINGGIKDFKTMDSLLSSLDGVMIGREAYHDPYLFSEVDARYFGDTAPPLSRFEVVMAYAKLIESELARGASLYPMIRPLLGLMQGMPGAKAWRRCLTEQGIQKTFDLDGLLTLSGV